MPLYKYECPECGNETEEFHSVEDRYNQRCQECGGSMDIVICPTAFHIFKPFWHPNLDSKPVWIRNRKHLREESEKRNMTSFY